MTWIWLGLTLFAIVIELFTTDLISIWFVGGGIVATILSFFDAITWQWQLLAFVIVTALLILSLRPLAKKILNLNKKHKTNVEALISQKIRMLSTANFDNLGTAKINGVIWSVKPIDGQILQEGSLATIVEVSGTKLVAKKYDDASDDTNNI